jgi:hypothetical protein
VEVTTGHWTASGKPHINHPKRSQARYSQTHWDVLAIVTETGIVYEPALPEDQLTEDQEMVLKSVESYRQRIHKRMEDALKA